MRGYRLDLLGAFRLRDPRGREIALPGRKLRAFVTYLALQRRDRRSREHLAGVFWGDRPDRKEFLNRFSGRPADRWADALAPWIGVPDPFRAPFATS